MGLYADSLYCARCCRAKPGEVLEDGVCQGCRKQDEDEERRREIERGKIRIGWEQGFGSSEDSLTDAEKNILLVEENELQYIHHWPIELRAIFDPAADLELARRIAASEPREDSSEEDDSDIPF